MVIMDKIKLIVFYLFLSSIAVFSSFGWQQGNETATKLILAGSVFLILFDLIRKKPIFIPKVPSTIFGLFFIFLSFSNFYSTSFKDSFLGSFFYLSLFLFFIFGYNHKQELKKTLPIFINLFAAVLIIAPPIISIITHKPFSVPFDDKNLIFPNHSPHNHLGDFLAGAVVLNLFLLREAFSWKPLILILFFLPFLFLSSSRSAYLSLVTSVICLLWYWQKIKKTEKNYEKILSMSLFSFIIVVATTLFISQNRPLLQTRQDYFTYAIKGVINKPLTGYGLKNFHTMVDKIKKENEPLVSSAHNIFLNFFAETGLVAGSLFFLMFITILIKGEKNFFWFIFVSLLTNFQTDYTYRIPLMILLLFLLAGTVWQEKRL